MNSPHANARSRTVPEPIPGIDELQETIREQRMVLIAAICVGSDGRFGIVWAEGGTRRARKMILQTLLAEKKY
jgi:hypothetical protein